MTSNEPRINRRTALKVIGVGVVGGVGFSGKAVAQPPPDEPTWGSDGTDHWQLMDANNPTPSNHESHRPLYGIAPANGAHSEHGTHTIGPHDHVVDTPGSGKAFTAEWHVFLFQEFDESDGWVLTNGSLTGSGDATSDGEGPTITKIDNKVAVNAPDDPDDPNDGDLRLVDTGVEFTCPVRPHNPTDED